MNHRIFVINFKTYEKGTGKEALKIAMVAEDVSKSFTSRIILAVQACDIRMITNAVERIEVFAQHVDPIDFGAHTGWILPESVRFAGAVGTLVNHSERRLLADDVKKIIERCKSVGLKTIVCSETPELSKSLALFEPDCIAIEPPELIGGDLSVSKAKPYVITETVESVRSVGQIPVLCGAGIKTGEDVRKAVELGASGILVASGIVKAKNPDKVMEEMLNGLEG